MKKALLATGAIALGALGLAPHAGADPISSGSARGFGAQIDILGQGVLPPSAEASQTAPPFGDDSSEALVPLDVGPIAVNFTANGIAKVHQASDLTSELEQSEQELTGPYNAQGIGSIEDLEVGPELLGVGIALVEADAVRSEAVAVCTGGTVQYSANAEVVNLVIAGEDPLSGPVNDLVAQIADALEPIADIVDIEIGTVTEVEGGGISIDALTLTVLGVLGEDSELVEIVIGHAEVGPQTCAPPIGPPPECRDGIDNDGDGVIDFPADNDCDGPDDPTERPECSDSVDNDGDGAIDFPADKQCDSPNDDKEAADCSDGLDNDGDGKIDFPNDPGCDSAQDDDEEDGSARTGIEMTSGLMAGSALMLAALGFGLLRRRALA